MKKTKSDLEIKLRYYKRGNKGLAILLIICVLSFSLFMYSNLGSCEECPFIYFSHDVELFTTEELWSGAYIDFETFHASTHIFESGDSFSGIYVDFMDRLYNHSVDIVVHPSEINGYVEMRVTDLECLRENPIDCSKEYRFGENYLWEAKEKGMSDLIYTQREYIDDLKKEYDDLQGKCQDFITYPKGRMYKESSISNINPL